ncbi:hypothetical protein ACHWQZ_G006611 [Mnemiopsis leidyi]
MDKFEAKYEAFDQNLGPLIEIKQEPKEFDDSVFECPVCNDNFSSLNHFTDHLNKGLKCTGNTTNENLIQQDDTKLSSLCKCEPPVVEGGVDDKPLKLSGPKADRLVTECQEAYIKEDKKSPKHLPYFLCPMCSSQLICEDDFEMHIKMHKSDKTKMFNCPLCEYNAPFNQNKAIRHLKKHSTKEPFRCSECPYFSKQKGNLNIHFRLHTGEKPYKCTECSYASAQSEPLKSHMRTHTGEKPFKCPLCPFAAAQKPSINYHIKITHKGESKEKKYKCSECTYCTRFKGDLKKHVMIHSGTKPFQCNLCSYSTCSKSNLTWHSRTHVQKSWKCKQCSFVTKYKKSLKQHQKRHETETGSIVYKCNYCTLSTNSKTSYDAHRRSCKGRQYKCPDCEKSFFQKRHLARHSAMHSSERNFKCSYPDCSYGTYRIDYLKEHNKKHRSETVE